MKSTKNQNKSLIGILGRYFVHGVLTIAPVTLTVYIVIWLIKALMSAIGAPVGEMLGHHHGLVGLAFSVVVITAVGFLSTNFITQRIVDAIDSWMQRVPFVKMIYNLFSDTLNTVLGEKQKFSKVALVRIPGSSAKIIGFVTAHDMASLGDFAKDHMAIYVMQSMQWAGHTFLVPKEDVELIDLPLDVAMKFVISAGIAHKKDNVKELS
ncbi:MAG: DUF502 domain-containing protein [Elusimicrobiota bacterium]